MDEIAIDVHCEIQIEVAQRGSPQMSNWQHSRFSSNAHFGRLEQLEAGQEKSPKYGWDHHADDQEEPWFERYSIVNDVWYFVARLDHHFSQPNVKKHEYLFCHLLCPHIRRR